MQEFIGCIQQSTGTYCLKAVNAGSQLFNGFVSTFSNLCAPYIPTNVTLVFNAAFQSSNIHFSMATSPGSNSTDLLNFLNCGSKSLGVVVEAAENARARAADLGLVIGCLTPVGILLILAMAFLAKEKCSQIKCRNRMFKPAPVSRAVPVVPSRQVSASENTASDVGEDVGLITGVPKKAPGCCGRK